MTRLLSQLLLTLAFATLVSADQQPEYENGAELLQESINESQDEELKDVIHDLFDTDKDGIISKHEFVNNALGFNYQTAINKDDLKTTMEVMFEKYDQDQSNQLERHEFDAFEQSLDQYLEL